MHDRQQHHSNRRHSTGIIGLPLSWSRVVAASQRWPLVKLCESVKYILVSRIACLLFRESLVMMLAVVVLLRLMTFGIGLERLFQFVSH